MNLLDVLYQPWAIVPDRLLEIQAIYAAHLRGETPDVAAIEARIGKPLKNEAQGYDVRDGAALIPLRGAIAKRANLFSQISGGASSELFVRDLRAAMDDPAVRSVVVLVDSPGGAVDGTQAAASALYAMRGKKPIAAWSDGTMASAAYWIGSAADSTWIDSGTVQIGSIGVVATHTDVSQRQEALGLKTTEIVAGKYKRIASQYGPLTESGRAAIQEQVDYLYSLFVADVAKQRGVDVEQVLSDMADGRIFVGQQAVRAGLVDGVATLDEIIATLNDRAAVSRRTTVAIATPKGDTMSPQETAAAWAAENAEAAAALRAEGAAAERQRIADVRAQSLVGHEALIEQLAADGHTTGAEAAVQVLAAERSRRERIGADRQADAPAPVPAAPARAEDDAPAAKVGAIAGSDSVATHEAALAHQAKNGVSYIEAVKAVQKGA